MEVIANTTIKAGYRSPYSQLAELVSPRNPIASSLS
jgi:hypothetical protein